jgi:hypothetical protein
MSVPGVELVGKQQQGRALTSEPLRRQATSPGGRSKLGRQGGRSRRGERHETKPETAPRFGGSGPCIVKVEQQFNFAFLDKWVYFHIYFLNTKLLRCYCLGGGLWQLL